MPTLPQFVTWRWGHYAYHSGRNVAKQPQQHDKRHLNIPFRNLMHLAHASNKVSMGRVAKR
jgi:hypothetical protein